MAYTTPGLKDRYIIDEAEADRISTVIPDGMSKGYFARPRDLFPEFCYADPFSLPLVDWAEVPERIKDMTAQKRWPKDHKKASGFKSLNQNGTNYCWINAPVQCIHYVRAMQGDPHVQLSPASVGAKIKNYRNVGGWGSQGIQFMKDNGPCPVELWPANAINRKYDTAESQAARAPYTIDEWYELRDRDFHQLVSCLCYGYPVAIGLNWWGHEVTACALAIRGSDPQSDTLTDIDNSWGENWGDEGHSLLVRSKATPDDAVVPRVVVA